MIRLITAFYDTVPQAELALAHLNSELGVKEGEIVDGTVAGRTRLARMNLSAEERERSARELQGGGYLVVARVETDRDPDYIAEMLRQIPRDGLGKEGRPANRMSGEFESFRVEDPAAAQAPSRAPVEAAVAPVSAAPPPAQRPEKLVAKRVHHYEGFSVEDPSVAAAPQAAAGPAPEQVAEERIPIVEEEIRIGKRAVLRGGARVHAQVAEQPVREEVELLVEHTSIERRPATRTLSVEEVEQGGLLRERVIEVSEMREEAVVSKQAFVREEVVVKKSVEHRTEVIEDKVRRTEFVAERLPGADSRPALSGLAPADPSVTRRR